MDALSQKDWESSKKFHGYIVGLYADYDPDKLLPFLKASDHYPIQEALGTSINIVTDTNQIVSQKLRLEINEELETDTNAFSDLRVDLVEIQGTGSKKKNFTLDETKEGKKCYV